MFRRIQNDEGQNANNLVKLYSSPDSIATCCGDAPAACQYDVTIPTANAVNNIIFKDRDGNNKTVTFSPAVTGAANVVAAIKAAIEADGYENDDDAVFSVTSETSGSNTIYHITGEAVVVSMLHNTSTTVTATAKCTRINRCTFSLDYAGNATTTFTVNGVNASLGSLTLAGNTAANVVAAIEGAANWPTTADVTVVETATAFEIRISDLATNTFAINTAEFERSNCAPGYIA